MSSSSIKSKHVYPVSPKPGGLNPIFTLKTGASSIAEITEHRRTWITVLKPDSHAELLLLAVAMLSRRTLSVAAII